MYDISMRNGIWIDDYIFTTAQEKNTLRSLEYAVTLQTSYHYISLCYYQKEKAIDQSLGENFREERNVDGND